MTAPMPAPTRASQPGAAAAHEHEERRREDGRQARQRGGAEEQAGPELRDARPTPRHRRAPSARRAAVMARNRKRGRHDVGQEPGGAQHAPRTRRRCRSRRRSCPGTRPRGAASTASSIRQQSPTLTAPRTARRRPRRWWPARRPPRTAAARSPAAAGTGSGRAAVPGCRQRQHVLEVVVAVRPVADRVGDGGAAVQPRVGLPHEVVVEVGAVGLEPT